MKGVRCIFGYSSDSVDNEGYGATFWKKWKVVNTTNAIAFLETSWQINRDQVPLVMCYGKDEADAQKQMGEQYFYTGRANANYGYWRWYKSKKVPELFEPKTPERAPTKVSWTQQGKANRLAQILKQFPDAQPAASKLAQVSSVLPRFTYTDLEGGGLQLTDNLNSQSNQPMTASDARAIESAKKLIARFAPLADLRLDSIRYEEAGGSGSQDTQVLAKTITFSRDAEELPSLDLYNTISVTFRGNLQFASLDNRLLGASSSDEESKVSLLEVKKQAQQTLWQEAKEKWPQANIKVLKEHFGWQLVDKGPEGQLTYVMLFEVTQGGATKWHELRYAVTPDDGT
jgi:hypothetical protein